MLYGATMATRLGKRSISEPWHRRMLRAVRHTRSVPADWWAWLLLPLCLLYMMLVVTHFSHILANVYGNADSNSPLVVSELFGERDGGHLITSNFPWYATLIFAEATKWLPAHRQIWEVGPYLFGLISIALMSWASWRVLGRGAAALTAVILLCAGPDVLNLMFFLTDHSPVWYSLALFAAFLVLLTDHRISIGRRPLMILTLFIGVIAGVSLATHTELLVDGLLPLLFAAIGTWVLCRTALAARAMWLALTVTMVTGIGAIATVLIMRSAGVITNGHKIKIVTTENISQNAKLLWQAFALVVNGGFSGQDITFTTVIALMSAALGVGVAFLIPGFIWRYVRDRQSNGEPLDAQLSAYMMFWAASIVCISLGFVFSSAPIFPANFEDTAYLVGILYAVAAIVPLLARKNVAMRAIAVAGTLVFLLNSFIALDNDGILQAPQQDSGPSLQVARDVTRVAEAMHATHGYGVYWDAGSITWLSNFKVLVAPIVGCPSSSALCRGANDYLESWYNFEPRRTFLLSDVDYLQWTPPAVLGRALAIYHFGTVTMYVYNYNVTEKLFGV